MDLSILFESVGSMLKQVRKSSGLTQEEVAKNIGITRRYIIKLEKGEKVNPTINIILNYLDVCNVRWADFFVELKRKMDKIDYDKIINEVGLSSATGLSFRQKRKIGRDIAYYRMRIDSTKGKAKALSNKQKNRAAIKFGKYRIDIEPIENEIQKKLGEIGAPIVNNQAYKDFARACFSTVKKYHNNQSLLTKQFNDIINFWKTQGLKEDVVKVIKSIVLSKLQTTD